MMQRILVIDDNEEILEFLSEILAEQYKVLAVPGAAEALQVLDNSLVDLIISDIMMPGMDGLQFCETIKSTLAYCHIPVVLLTAKNSQQSQVEGLEVGADAYVRKPFLPDLLLLQIENLLKNRRKIKEHFASSPFGDVRVMAYSRKDEEFLRKLDEFIRQQLSNVQIDIRVMAKHMHMSRPTFYRKLKSLSSLSPKELIDLTRLKEAAALIAENQYTLSEIAVKTGYRSQSVFAKNFQRYFHQSPTEYLRTMTKSS